MVILASRAPVNVKVEYKVTVTVTVSLLMDKTLISNVEMHKLTCMDAAHKC